MRSAVRTTGGTLPAESSGSSTTLALGGLLLVALLIRLVFIGSEGFKNDVASFEAWSLTLAAHSTRDFFANVSFADYPPGYFFVLWVVGHAYRLLVHDDPTYGTLKLFVKLPAILMDLVDSWLLFAIVRRFASLPWAFAAAALFAFNPVTIFISAYWGQVDSVAAGVTLGSLLLLIDADRSTGTRAERLLVGSWLLLAYSILIKPPAIVLVFLYVAYAFATADPERRLQRLRATGLGIVGALALAFLAAFAFHPGWNPLGQYAWLFERYRFAANVYPYNSINAFNLYAMVHPFWQSDTEVVPNWNVADHAFGLPQWQWGVLLFLAAVVLVVSRYVQRRDDIMGLLEAATILSLGYFILSTRMHERYVFNALVLALPLIAYRRRYLYAAVVLSLTLLANLFYSFDYLYVLDAKVPNVDPTNLMPFLSRFCSFANVATFFALGYLYLGDGAKSATFADLAKLPASPFASGVAMRARRWFSPLQGTARMLPVDWGIATVLGIGSFLLTFFAYQWPTEKIFDEIYYARAGEEYLAHKEVFEFTHPPFTKLLVTASMMLFGGLHGLGDTAFGWRFLNLVVAALMVVVLYAFAKRLTNSTLFASLAAGFLLFDGFHYAQARIATPEITVAFFSLTTLYAFYRFWIASQARVAAEFGARSARAGGIALGVATLLSAGLTAALVHGQALIAVVVTFLYFEVGAYLAIRLLLPRFVKSRSVTSYADGSRVAGNTLLTLDGGAVPLEKGALTPGSSTRADKNALVYVDDGVRVEYARGGAVRYQTDEGTATFSDGDMRVGAGTIDGRRDARVWLAALSISAAILASCKWNGLFDFFVVWLLAGGVAVQAYWGDLQRAIGRTKVSVRPAQWGNPFGVSFDVLMAAMLFAGATVYTLCYIPYYTLGHNLADMIAMQQSMYHYHSTLVATHPYSSKWWQWPILQIPISYYYHDFRTGAAMQNANACCVAEILALPNPLTWWTGLFSVPYVAWLGWRERDKGFVLLATAYFMQWLPWIGSPRLSFEYHFFPNLAIICLADAVLLQRVWRLGAKMTGRFAWPRVVVIGYTALAVAAFAFWYPVVAGTHVTYAAWNARMIGWLEGNNWINPHPGS